VVELLTGADNTSSYTSFGFLRDDKRVQLFRTKQNEHFLTLSKMLSQFILLGDECQLARMGYTCMTSKLCRRCGRKLTTPESITAGIGPECAAKAGL